MTVQQLQAYSISAPGFYGLNTQDSSLDLASGFALSANNCIIDQYGRIGARKGWSALHTTASALSGQPIRTISSVVGADGTEYILAAGNNKLFYLSGTTLTALSYGGGGVAPTISASNWQAVSLNGKLYLFQANHDPLVFEPETSTTVYKRVSEMTGYSGTVQSGNTALSAYGRLWNAATGTDKFTIQWSDVLDGAVWDKGTAGDLDTTTVWPKGGDTITGLGAHNGFLYIFGKNNILIYAGATDPTTMTLQDVVTGIGCISRDSVANTGSDIVFLSKTGVRSLLRTIQEKSAPLRELSKNVRNDLMSYVEGETDTTIKAVYSPVDAFYLLTLQNGLVSYCFDTKAALQDGSARVTTWSDLDRKSTRLNSSHTDISRMPSSA